MAPVKFNLNTTQNQNKCVSNRWDVNKYFFLLVSQKRRTLVKI